jgi:hypothetical protein
VAASLARQGSVEIQDTFAHLRMIQAVSWRCLRLHLVSAVGDEFGVGVLEPHPIGGGIGVHLDRHLEPEFVGQFENLFQVP